MLNSLLSDGIARFSFNLFNYSSADEVRWVKFAAAVRKLKIC